ncbi:MAG TPA: hypothetical protein PKD55_03070 [Bellilinea sp.]|nr:hypothetical protein [Bellilinea sp.]
MKIAVKLGLFLLSTLILSGCAEIAPFFVAPTPTWQPYAPIPSGASLARNQLANIFGVAPERVSIQTIDSAKWTDTCLGIEPRDNCASAELDGYIVTMQFEGVEYIYHTDLMGNYIRAINQVTSPAQATIDARDYLSTLLGISANEIEIASETSVQFSDTCLDIGLPGNVCGKYPTWGIRSVLTANNRSYEFRMLQNSAIPRLARIDSMDAATPVLRWVKQGGPDNSCLDIAFFLSGFVNIYSCQGVTAEQPGFFDLNTEFYSQLLHFVLNNSDFNLQQDDQTGSHQSVNFVGLGSTPPAEETKAEIKSFAESTYQAILRSMP